MEKQYKELVIEKAFPFRREAMECESPNPFRYKCVMTRW